MLIDAGQTGSLQNYSASVSWFQGLFFSDLQHLCRADCINPSTLQCTIVAASFADGTECGGRNVRCYNNNSTKWNDNTSYSSRLYKVYITFLICFFPVFWFTEKPTNILERGFDKFSIIFVSGVWMVSVCLSGGVVRGPWTEAGPPGKRHGPVVPGAVGAGLR